MAMGHHGIKEEAQQTHSVEVREVVYYKSVLGNHNRQHAKFKHKHNSPQLALLPLYWSLLNLLY